MAADNHPPRDGEAEALAGAAPGGDPMHPIRLIVTLCLSGPHCFYPRPVWFPTWHACAVAGEAMVSHARRIGRGDVGFACLSEGGDDGQ